MNEFTVERSPEYFKVDFDDGDSTATVYEPRLSASAARDVRYYKNVYETELHKTGLVISLVQNTGTVTNTVVLYTAETEGGNT